MAKIVVGIGASHGPPTEVRPEKWDVFRQKDETDKRMDYPALLKRAPADMAAKITPARWQEYFDTIQKGLATLKAKLAQAKPDLIVIISNDQREMFMPSNTPMFAIYTGNEFKSVPMKQGKVPDWVIESSKRRNFDRYYPVAQPLAKHITKKLVGNGFDLTVCDGMPDGVGMGHGAMFLYERLVDPDNVVPTVPIIINTFYPPNQAPVKRCYELGVAIRTAVESFGSAERVGVVCSGGLSHFVMDEELDRRLIDAMQKKDREAIFALPEEQMVHGTSELRNWIAAAGALEPLKMTLVDYFQAPRTLAGTGLAFGFACWE
jgi:hypothetical protein